MIEHKSTTRKRLSAWVAALTTVTAICGAVFAGWQSWLSNQTLKEMHDEQRPWFGAPAVEPQNRGGAGWGFRYTLANVGKVPPKGIAIEAVLFKVGPTPASTAAWQKKARSLCDRGEGKAKHDHDQFIKWSVVPGSPLVLRDIDDREDLSTELNGKHIPPGDGDLHIIGCLVYGGGDGSIHYTQFAAPLNIRGSRVNVLTVYTIEPS